MTSQQAYNTIITKANHSVNLKSQDGLCFVQDAHRTARILFKRIKEIKDQDNLFD